MRKLTFYPKLALGNLWRNRSTYLPYLLACTVSVFTFYTMLAINTNGALDGIRGESVVKSFTSIGTFILAIFCSILIFYTNSFLVKRRKKELGLYSILGMEKKNIGVLMFFETLLVAALALALGVGLGLLLSQLLFWVLLRMVRFPVMMEMPISLSAVGVTLVFFAVVFMLALLFNLRQVHIASPVNLLAGANQGEKEPKASWLITVVGLLCLAGGYFVALYFTSPVEAILMFLLAVALVIIGTYCLFTSGSIALLKLMRKNKKFYYQPNHFISVSGMIYRMKQNAAGLATICILSCMVLVTVSSTVALNVGSEDSLMTQFPHEYSLSFYTVEDGDQLLEGARQAAEESGVSLVNLEDYQIEEFIASERDGGFFTDDDNSFSLSNSVYFSLITLDEYNKNQEANTILAPDEALLLVTGGQFNSDSLTLNDITYRVRQLEEIGKSKAGGQAIARSFTLLLPSREAVEAQLAAGGTESNLSRTLSFDLEGTDEAKALFAEKYNHFVNSITTNEYFQYRAREDVREDWYASNGGFLFLGIYFGILFMLAAALIIYYKQLSEGYDDAKRFEILQKVGMSEHEVKKTVNRQILTVFFLPLLVAVIHVAVAFFPISRAMVVFGVVNTPLLVVSSIVTILTYALIYLLVFRRTARTYFGIVRRQSSTT